MSITAIDWAEQQPTGSSGTRQLLVTLANAVSDQPTVSKFGRKWPAFHAYMSIASLCDRTLQDRKTIIANLKRLEDGGFIRRAGTDGITNQSVVFCLSMIAGEPVPKTELAPVPETALVPDLGPVPFSDATSTVFPSNQYRFSQSPVPKTGHGTGRNSIEQEIEPERAATRQKRKSRISPDWQLSESLRAWTEAERPGLHIDSVLANFRDHYLAKGEARADWDASWRTWVRRERMPDERREQLSGETTYQRSMRERMAEIVPSIARQAPSQTRPLTFLEEVQRDTPALPSKPSNKRRRPFPHLGTDQRNYEEGFDVDDR